MWENWEILQLSKNIEGKIKEYTIKNSPIVFIVETHGYSASTPLTKYKSYSKYTKEGIIYIYPGCRGRESDTIRIDWFKSFIFEI